MEQSSDIYPPKRPAYNPNFRDDAIESAQVAQNGENKNQDVNRSAKRPFQGLALPAGREHRDPILDSTPKGTPVMDLGTKQSPQMK